MDRSEGRQGQVAGQAGGYPQASLNHLTESLCSTDGRPLARPRVGRSLSSWRWYVPSVRALVKRAEREARRARERDQEYSDHPAASDVGPINGERESMGRNESRFGNGVELVKGV